MSSFIHTNCHFNSVEKAIQLALAGGTSKDYCYNVKKKLEKLNTSHYGVDAVWEKVSEYMDEIRKLSSLCVSLQYKHHYEGVLDKEIQEQTAILLGNKSEWVELSDAGLYKALSSMMYQIELEHLKELRELTDTEKQALEMCNILINDIAHDLVRRMDDYENANWRL